MQCGISPIIRLCSAVSRRYSTLPAFPTEDFLWYPGFFDQVEQHALLSAALRKLDAVEPRASRKRRRDFLVASRPDQPKDIGDMKNAFLPDDLYHFEEGHYDGVIRRFREMRVSTWDEEKDPVVKSALGRLETLYPDANNTQTHILHLSANGEIHPHVDNVGASGSWILGVSLGSERMLRMEPVEDVDGILNRTFDVSLSSGSVYIQKNTVRYNYKHSILYANSTLGEKMSHGQRVSIMVRVRSQL
ncbi:hypothetical protein V8E52_002317 [Russula decolorans]